MAISFPYDLLDSGAPFWSTDFDLMYRQEQSRTAGGRTFVKDLGSPLWAATYQSRSLKPNELDYWRARLKALDNGFNQFYGRPRSRCYPIAYPNGNYFGTDSFTNKLTNPGFETGVLTPWVPSAGVTAYNTGAHSGTYCMLMDKGAAGIGAGTQREAWQLIDGIVAGKQYNLGAWFVGAAPSAAGANLRIQWRNAANGVITTSNIITNAAYTVSWQYMSGSIVAPALATRALIYVVFGTGGAAQHLLVDDIFFARYETFTGLNAQVNSINANRKAITLKGLNGGYTGSVGDYIQIGSNLHQVLEPFTANSAGTTGEFEIRPHLWPTTVVNDTVATTRPSALMTMMPGSLSSTAELTTGRGVITFQAIESR